jgi:broad specificity phosphatase PhoE
VSVGEPPAGRPASTWVPPADTPTTLYLVRHGSTAHSAQWRFSGQNHMPLDEAGRVQAAALAKARPMSTVTAIVSSPVLRARQTADAIADELGLEVRVEDGLAETDFGRWEGMTFAEVEQRRSEELTRWLASTAVAPPGGESFDAVAARVRRARDRIVAAHPGQVVAAVSHVTPIKTIVRLALDAPPVALFKMHLDTASISRVDYYADGNASVRLLNDTHHLS